MNPFELSDDECVAYAQAVQRQQGWTDALLVQVTARFVEHRPGPPPDCESLAKGSETRIQPGGEPTATCGSYAAAEWGAVLGTSTWSAARLIADALDLHVRLPAMRAAVRIGMCDLGLARTLATRTRDLSAETALAVEEAVIPRLPMTRSRLEALVDRMVARVEPAARERRVRQVRERREVWIDATNDDHAEISGTLDAIVATRLDSRLDELARLLGLVQRGGVLGFGPAEETWQQRRARALGLLPDPVCVEALLHAARTIPHPRSADTCASQDGSQAKGEATEQVGDEPAVPEPAVSSGRPPNDQHGGRFEHTAVPPTGIRPTTLYVHLRDDGTTDLEGQGVLSLPAAGATRHHPGHGASSARPHHPCQLSRLPPVRRGR